MANFIVVMAFLIGGGVGILIMALFAGRSYEKGYNDGYEDSGRDDEWLKELFGRDGK